MLRAMLCVMVMAFLSFSFAHAEEVKGKLTKIDEKAATVDGKEYSFAKECKFFKQVKKVKEEIKDGYKADEFKSLPTKGLAVSLTTNDKNEVTEVLITKKGKKKDDN